MLRTFAGYMLILFGLMFISIFIYELLFGGGFSLKSFFAVLFFTTIMFFQGIEYLKRPKTNLQIREDMSSVGDIKAAENVVDQSKRNELVRKLRKMSGPLVIPIAEFLDGNYADQGSIGCNLYPEHPGIDVFRSTFQSLLDRNDVETIYAHVSEIEPDESSWPYADKVYVFGSIPKELLREYTMLIQPTEIGDRKDQFSPITNEIRRISEWPLICLWWD